MEVFAMGIPEYAYESSHFSPFSEDGNLSED